MHRCCSVDYQPGADVQISSWRQADEYPHGSFDLHCSVGHIHNVYFAPSEQVRAAARPLLQISCQVLSEIGQVYRNALRALEIITSLKSELARSKSSRSRPGDHDEYRSTLNKRARLDPNNQGLPRSSIGQETDAQLFAAPAMEGLDVLEECLHVSPSSTLMASGSLFTEPWGWISPPNSFNSS